MELGRSATTTIRKEGGSDSTRAIYLTCLHWLEQWNRSPPGPGTVSYSGALGCQFARTVHASHCSQLTTATGASPAASYQGTQSRERDRWKGHRPNAVLVDAPRSSAQPGDGQRVSASTYPPTDATTPKQGSQARATRDNWRGCRELVAGIATNSAEHSEMQGAVWLPEPICGRFCITPNCNAKMM